MSQIRTAACFEPRTATVAQAQIWRGHVAGRAAVLATKVGRADAQRADLARMLCRWIRSEARMVLELVELLACVCDPGLCTCADDPLRPLLQELADGVARQAAGHLAVLVDLVDDSEHSAR